MKLILFFIFIPMIYSGTHTFITTHTVIRGQTAAGIPEFVAVSSLDGHQIDYYDSNTKKLIPKQPWMKEFALEELWKKYIELRDMSHRLMQQMYNIIIGYLMEEFSQSDGVHTYQRRFGCDYDDVTGESRGFDEYGYDGQDFISLNLKQHRYTAHVPQAMLTVENMNNNTAQLEFLKKYFEHECVDGLKKLLKLKKKRRAPEVFLLQKDSSSPVSCHATGFYPSRVSISWLRNGVTLRDVDLKETLPNGDGTFQRTLTLRVTPDKWKKNQYTCEVEHRGKTFRKILTDNEIKTNYRPTEEHIILFVCVMGVTIIILVPCTAVCIIYKKRSGFKPVSCEREEVLYIDKGL